MLLTAGVPCWYSAGIVSNCLSLYAAAEYGSTTEISEDFRRKQNTGNPASTRRTTTAPPTIPPIAPPDSPLEVDLLVVVGPELTFCPVAVVTVTVAVETIPPLVKVVRVVNVVRDEDVICV